MYLIRINLAANMNRYYQIEISADLFGGALLIRSWGRIGRRGQERRQWFDHVEAAATAQQAWAARKCQRGYQAERGPL